MKANLSLVVIMGILISAACSFGLRTKPFCLPYEHVVDEDILIQPAWSISDMYVFPNGFQPMILGTPSQVFVATFDLDNGLPTFVALDAQTGNILWERKTDWAMNMLITDPYLLVAEQDHVNIYNPDTGALMHDVYAPGVGTIQIRYVESENLYAVTGHGRWLTYNFISQQKSLSKPGLLYPPFMAENGVLYRVDFEGFKAIEENTDRVIWVHQLYNEVVDTQPIFTDNSIILKTNGNNIWVLDRNTGDLIWEIQSHIISNLTLSKTQVIFLTQEGNLVSLDKETGENIKILQFSEVPFLINTTSDTIYGGYFVWADLQTDRVVVSLGDTCQLLAFDIKDSIER